MREPTVPAASPVYLIAYLLVLFVSFCHTCGPPRRPQDSQPLPHWRLAQATAGPISQLRSAPAPQQKEAALVDHLARRPDEHIKEKIGRSEGNPLYS